MRAGMNQMTITRRGMALGLVSLTALSACGRSPRGAAMAGPGDAPPPRPAPASAPNAGFDDWVVSFKNRAASQGFTQAQLDSAFRGVGYLPSVVANDNKQTEFKLQEQWVKK